MKTVPRLKPLNRTENGVALILTLSFIVLTTILIVGFVVSMRTERQAAASMANNEKVKVVAEVGLEHAIALLQKNIPRPAVPGATPTASSGTNWYVNPGQLTTVSSAATATIPLYSGNSTSTTDPNLNRLKLDGTHYDILGTSEPMQVAWVNLLKDPSKAASATNPMTGRYAFWIDDENNKINLNTAGQKSYASTSGGRFTSGNPQITSGGSTFTLGHPASVDLGVLSGLDVGKLTGTTSSRPLGSVQEVKQFATSPQDFYETNKFSLTHFNSDPEFNAFGKSRIFFAGSMAYPYSYVSTSTTNPFWDTGYAYRSELTTSGSTQATVADPTEPLIFHSYLMQDVNTYGFNGSTSLPGVPTTPAVATTMNGTGNPAATTVRRILTYLNTPFPGYTNNFVQKYGVREANQIAWNIYGMAASATAPNTTTTSGAWANTTALKSPYGGKSRWGACLWDAWDPTTNAPLLNATGETVKILPQTRSPFISKVGVGFYLSNKPVSGQNDPSGFMKNSAGVVATSSNTPSPSSQIYGVRINFAFEWFLPKGYQGFQSASGWDPTNDRVWVVHFEAKFNGQKIVLTSLSDTNALDTTLKGSDGPMEYKAPTSPMNPNTSSEGQRMPTVNLGALSTGDATQSPTQSTGWPNGLGFGYTWDAVATPTMTISDIKIRFVAAAGILDPLNPNAAGKRDFIPYQISPMRDIDRTSSIDTGFESGDATTGAINFPGTIVLQTGGAAGAGTSAFGMGWRGGVGSINEANSVWCVMETTDPRVNQLATDWKKSETPTNIYGTKVGNTCGIRTVGTFPVSSADGDESKLAFPDVSSATTGRPHDTDKALSSVGWLSTVSTGMQSGKPWRTLKFQPGGAGDPPDYLLMDLFAVPFNALALPAGQKFPDMTGPAPLTYMNATSGKVNINAKIFPTDTNFAPPARTLPLQALFQNMYRGASQVSAATAQTIASNVLNRVPASGGTLSGSSYAYPGQICEVAGVADTGANEWEKEALVRNLGSLITTRSNAFSVWGVAQTIKKVPKNLTGSGALPGEFQAGDVVTGERRFRAVVERYVWPGVDGLVGNAKSASGAYSELGANSFLGSPLNTKDGTNPTAVTFEQSYNPQAAIMKYRVRSFEFLDE